MRLGGLLGKLGAFAVVSVVMAARTDGAILAHYRFEGGPNGGAVASLLDSGPNGVNGTVSGRAPAPRFTSSTAGTPDAGQFAFDVTGDGGSATVSSGLSTLQPGGSFTLEFYVRPSVPYGGSNPDNDYVVMMKNAESGTSIVSYGVGWLQSSSRFVAELDTSVSTGGSQAVTLLSDVTAAGVWHHVALVFADNGSNDTASLYVDHVLQGSVSGDFPVYYNTSVANAFVIGAGNFLADESGSFRRNFGGLIDEVRLSDQALMPSAFLAIPEPASLAGVVLPVAMMSGRRRSRFRAAEGR